MLDSGAILQSRYRIVRQLGRGGMGAVYEAVDERFGSTVALKQTLVDADHLLKAFEREAQLLNSLRHPVLPHVFDYFVEDGGQFLVMQFIPGDDLGARLAANRRPFVAGTVLRWAEQLLDALDYLHSHEPPILHRDIKPQNLKLTTRSDIVLLDFGLAKGETENMSRMTQSVAGFTPAYAAPEQILLTGSDPRTDLYGLGATLYHMLTGALPANASVRAGRALHGEPDPLRPAREVNPAIPAAVSEWLASALAIKREARTPSAEAMRAELSEAVRAAREEDPASLREGPAAATRGIPRSTEFIAPETDFGTYDPETAETRLYEARSSAPDRLVAATGTAPAGGPGSDRSADRGRTERAASPPGRRSAVAAVGVLVAVLGLVFAWWASRPDSASPSPVTSVNTAPASPPVTSVTTAPAPSAVPPGMVFVSGGTFTMGRDGAKDPAEGPAHPVTVSSFFIDRTEVTNAAYAEFVRATGFEAPPTWKNGAYPMGEGDFPVVNVSWKDARAYAEWAGKRLPSEVEWEYAARGTDQRLFPWGSNPRADAAATSEGRWKGPQPVGTFPAGVSPFGLADMYGNVWEWCEDVLRPYSATGYVIDDRDVNLRILRGGSFESEQTGDSKVTLSSRSAQIQEFRDPKLGFRCAKSISNGATPSP